MGRACKKHCWWLSELQHSGRKSTLHLLDYLSSAGFKYIMTAKLSQDKLENKFSIIRQSSHTNDHPTAAVFGHPLMHLHFITLLDHPSQGTAHQMSSARSFQMLKFNHRGNAQLMSWIVLLIHESSMMQKPHLALVCRRITVLMLT